MKNKINGTVQQTNKVQKPEARVRTLNIRRSEESSNEVAPIYLAGGAHSAGWHLKYVAALFMLCATILMRLPVLAVQNVTLGWDPSASTNIAGYTIYYGTASGDYTNKISVGNVTNAVVSGLVDGATYYFAATSYDNRGMESQLSSEVSYTVPSVATLSMQTIVAQGATTSVIITATGAIPNQWALESSTDLKNWTTIAGGTNVSVNISVPTTGIPSQFFRLKSQ